MVDLYQDQLLRKEAIGQSYQTSDLPDDSQCYAVGIGLDHVSLSRLRETRIHEDL